MKFRALFVILTIAALLVGLAGTAAAQDTPRPETGAAPTVKEAAPEAPAPAPALPAGIEAVSTGYAWSQTSGTYTEITGGTVQCTPGSGNTYCDDVVINNVALGFTFTFNGTAYTAVGLSTNGFVRMGSTAFTGHCGYAPISSTDTTNCVNLVSGLGEDQQGNTTDAELRTETLGTAPNRVFVIQYKNWRHYSATSESYNYQIRLYETSNLVEVVYGSFTKNATNRADQIGLKGTTNADFNNRSGTGSWLSSVAGTVNTATMALTSTYYPPSGLTWDWTAVPPHPIFDTSYKTATAQVVMGGNISYVVHIKNTGDLAASAATMVDPIPAGTTYNNDVTCSSGTCGFDGTNVTWAGTVAIGGDETVSFSVGTAGVPCGTVTNQATMNDPGLYSGPVTRSASTQLVATIPTPLEGFETSVPPPGWTETIVNDPGTDPDWTRESAGTSPTISPHGGTYMAKFNSFTSPNLASSRLWTGALDLSAYAAPAVVFWMSHDTGYSGNADEVQIQVSTDGITWVNAGAPVLRYDASCATACWKEHTVLLPAGYNVNGVYIGFLGISAYGNNFFLDDVALSEGWYPCPYVSLAPDAAKSGCPGGSVDYTLTLINMAPNGDTFNLTVAGNAWPTTLNPVQLVLGPGQSGAVAASVSIPWTPGSDTAVVTALGQTYGGTDTATLVTTGSPTYWTQIATEVNNGRMDNVLGAYDGKVWSITGYGANLNVRTYDPATDTWTVVGTPPTFTGNYARSGCQAGSKVYMYGDTSTAGFTGLWSYDMATTTWTAETPSGTPPATTGIWAPAWAYDEEEGLCYLTGGATVAGAGNLTTVYVYDPVSNAWLAPLPSFTTARDFHAAWVLTDNEARKLLCVAGGNASTGALASTQCYDLTAGAWGAENADMGALTADWWGMGYTKKVHDDVTQLWMTGGVRAGGITNVTSFFDVLANAWADDGTLPGGAVYRTAAVTLDNEMYAVGGSIGSFSYTGLAHRHVQCCMRVEGADFTVDPTNPRPLLPATFTGSVAAGSTPITYDWSFGDGAYGSGQVVQHTYAAVGDYTVFMTATNCVEGYTSVATRVVTVMAGPLIEVTPSALSSTQCPDVQVTELLTICNRGDEPLIWDLSEITGTRALGAAPIPPRRTAPARSDDASAFPRIESENHILANPVLIIQDQYPWGYASTQNILTANGIAYDQVGSSQMATIDLSPYELVIIPSDQSAAFYTAWNANLARFEAYVSSGGALWIGTATAPTGLLPDPLLPGGVALIDDMFDYYDAVVAAGHPWVAGVSSPFYGSFASHGEFSNLYAGSIVVTTGTTTGNPTLVDYMYGSGRVLITGVTLEITWAYGWGGAPILQNSLLDMYNWAQGPDVLPWVSEDPTSGTVAPGDCVVVEVTFDSNGMAPGTYNGTLRINSNDTLNPVVDVPLTMIVAGPPTGVDFDYTPPAPFAFQEVTFNGTATALLPVEFSWDFGDGNYGSGQNPTHTYGAAGTYTAIMTATQCGFEVVMTHTITVLEPPVCESFFDAFEGTFPPAGWTVINNGGACVWQRNDAFATARPNYTGGTGFCADADSDTCGSGTTMNTELRTPVFSLFATTAPVLYYRYDYYDIGAADQGTVDISLDGGATWANLVTYLNDDRGPAFNVIDLSAYAGQMTVQLRFTYVAPGWDWWFEVDDVQLHCEAVPDIAVDPTSLTQTLYPDQTAAQTFNIANVGLAALDWTIDEGCGTPVDWLSESPSSGTVPANGDIDVQTTFDSTGLGLGTYNTTLCVNSNDPDENPVLVDVTLIVTGTPDIAVTPASLETTLCQGDTDTQYLNICNNGTGPLVWSLSEQPEQMAAIPVVPGVALPVEAVSIPQGPASPAIADSGVSSGTPVVGPPANPIRPDDIGDAWEVMAPLPSARVFNAVVAAGPYIYVIGGTSDAGGLTPTATNYRYNTGDNTWSTMTPMPAALAEIDGITIGGMIYIPGSDPDSNTYVYDTATDTWSVIPANGGYAAPVQYQVVAIGTDLYVLGGIISGASTPNVWVLDTTTGTWAAGVPMQKSRTSFSAAAIGANIYVAGGVAYPGFTPDMTAEMFDGTAWSYIAPVPNGGGAYTRWSYNADGMAPGALWLGAGRRDAGWAVLNHAGYYDVATDTWTDSPTIPMLNQGRVYMEGDVGSDGYFYVIGGRDSAGAIAYATNERLMVYSSAVDIPWLTEVPTNSVLLPGECISVAVTFDSDALPAGVYSGDLLIESNDPDEPEVTIPVEMTVLAAPSGADFLWSPLEPLIGQTAYFSGTVAGGSAPLTWSWTFGDGGTATGQYATHIYAVPGDYLVTLTVANTCGQVVVEHTVTVIGEADIIVTPSSLAATLCPDATTTMTVTICNEGDIPLDWALSEAPAVKLGGLAPAVAGGQTRKVELSLQGVPAKAKATSPWQPDGLVNLVLDDGTAESFIGLNDGTYGYQFLWLNRFTPSPADYPFNLTQIAVLLGATNVPLGGAVDLVAYQDTDGDGDPSNAVWLATYHVTIQANDGATWSVYNLATPVTLSGPGDVLIGVINRYEESGVDLKDYPAGIDRTAPSQQRSWIGAWNLDPPDPALLPPDADGMWDLIDNFGLAGNWMVRGGGETIYDIPWLSEDPTSGTVPPGECVDVAVTFDSTGMAAGVYNGNLVISSNDPDTPQVTIPVEMTVLEPATIVDVTYTVTGLQVAFDATATGAAPLTFAWTFGDGGTSNLEDPTHVYAGNGCYPVTLTVSNACGEDIWTGEVCISYYHYYYLPIISRNYTP